MAEEDNSPYSGTVRIPTTGWTPKLQAYLVQPPAPPNPPILHKLSQTPIVVGRGDGCDIRIVEQSVSRQHARLSHEGVAWYLFDLQSTNGTTVNRRPITRHRLEDGDIIAFGNISCRFLVGDDMEHRVQEPALWEGCLRPVPVGEDANKAAMPSHPLADSWEETGRLEPAFSSYTIVALMPAPIAVPYRRFLRQKDPTSRLLMLFAATESLVRYLVTLAVSDLLSCLSQFSGAGAALPDHPSFAFLQHRQPMQQGMWLATLRESCRLLKGYPRRFILELPAAAEPGGDLDQVLTSLIGHRNRLIHPEGTIAMTPEECARAIGPIRTELEQALQTVDPLVRKYPLGFATRGLAIDESQPMQRYYLHSCMGSRIAATHEAYGIETVAQIREELPFVVHPQGTAILYLWPMLLQRRSPISARRTLYAFEDMPDRKRPFLTKIRSAPIDVREEPWHLELMPEPRTNHGWLLERMRELPMVLQIPSTLGIGTKLQPVRGGKLVNRFLGDCWLFKVIATGGFATIYAAQHMHGRTQVAVKVLEDLQKSPEARRHYVRFKQEFERLQGAAQHPGIIRCFDLGSAMIEGQEYPWYSMELALGGDLIARLDERRRVAGDRLPWWEPALRRDIIEEFRAVASAVAHLHELNIVHRDIKPGNVLVMDNGELRLSDFGLVKKLNPSVESALEGPESSEGVVMGTRTYMAPEQQRGPDVGKEADVYSLGILFAELTTGTTPVARPHVSSGSTLQDHPLLHELPIELQRFIRRCTDVSPDRRFVDGQAVCTEFARLVNTLENDFPTADASTGEPDAPAR